MLTVFVVTILVLCASLFALMAIVPLMLEKHVTTELPDNVVPLSRKSRMQDDVDLPAA